jgi:hypothetical protein
LLTRTSGLAAKNQQSCHLPDRLNRLPDRLDRETF